MATVRDVEKYMETRIPRTLSVPGDPDGTSLCPDGTLEVRRAVAALDVTLGSIEFARTSGAQLIVTHHPCIYGSVSSVTDATGTGRRLIAALKANIALMAYHTRLDTVDGGVNDSLCALLGFDRTEKFCGGLGRLAYLPEVLSYKEFRAHIAKTLQTDAVTGIDCGRPVKKIAVLGGGGKSTFYDALATGADTYLTGEVPHNILLDAEDMKINLVCATHYRTESPVVPSIKRIINEGFPDIEVLTYYDKNF